jgi:hypothetical protein
MTKLYFLLLSVMTTAFLVAAQESNIGYMDGNLLLEKCDSAGLADKSFCDGYVAAAIDSHATLINSLQAASEDRVVPKIYCLPKGGIVIGQAVRVTVKWLHDHPEKLHLAGDILVAMAMKDGFPCK